MSIVEGMARVLDKSRVYDKPATTDIHGVVVKVSRPNDEWKPIITEWFDRFEAVGWLDGFDSLVVSDRYQNREAIGKYDDGAIVIDHTMTNNGWQKDQLIEFSKRAVLIHEMIHHAHIYHGGVDDGFKQLTVQEQMTVGLKVSDYAEMNVYEAIAEIGTAIALDKDVGRIAENIYEKYDGPPEVYEIRRTC